MYYNYPTTMNEKDIRIHTKVKPPKLPCIFLANIVNTCYIFLPEIRMGENTFIYCSRISVVPVFV